MSFQAYMDNIQTKTGKSPAEYFYKFNSVFSTFLFPLRSSIA